MTSILKAIDMKRNNTATGNPHILLTAMGIQRDHWESRTLSTKSTKNHRTPKQTTKQNKTKNKNKKQKQKKYINICLNVMRTTNGAISKMRGIYIVNYTCNAGPRACPHEYSVQLPKVC